MAPTAHFPSTSYVGRLLSRQATTSRPMTPDWRGVATNEDFVIESWSQGFMVGALLIMACITVANMRRGVLLHKLILAELLLAMSHGTFCFMSFNGYGWYLSSTAALLYISWIIHNYVTWMKVRPFFSQPGGFFNASIGVWVKRVYLGTLALSIPVIAFQISNNFRFFNHGTGWYKHVRPWEPLFRDPWWVFTCIVLFHVIRKCYGTGVTELIVRSPRFGILLGAICLSIVFTILDIAASIHTFIGTTDSATDGINPWWKLSLVFKCLTDTIMLDDFKTELKRLGIKRIAKEEKRRNSVALVLEQESVGNYARNSGADDDEAGYQASDKAWFGSHTWRERTSSPSISPTMGLTPTNTNRSIPKRHGGSPLRDPNARMEDLDFLSALDLDPPHSDKENQKKRRNSRSTEHIEDLDVSTQPKGRAVQERDTVNAHTTKISRLPGLRDFRFEAIKPGKKSRHTNHDGDDEDSDDDDKHNTTERQHDPLNPINNDSREDQTRTARRDTIIPNLDQGGIQSQLKKENARQNERIERQNRFRQSIGVLEPS